MNLRHLKEDRQVARAPKSFQWTGLVHPRPEEKQKFRPVVFPPIHWRKRPEQFHWKSSRRRTGHVAPRVRLVRIRAAQHLPRLSGLALQKRRGGKKFDLSCAGVLPTTHPEELRNRNLYLRQVL